MRYRHWFPFVLGLVLFSSGCAATHREWEVWRAHSTHFASNNHLGFSMSRMVGVEPEVTPQLMETAKAEGWWGQNTPFVAPRPDVTGRWEGHWSGYGMSRTLRGGIAMVELNVPGPTGEGRLVLVDARLAEGVPVAVREASSYGAPIEVSVSDTGMWVNGTEPGRAFAATFTLQGDKMIGRFLYTNSPVRIELTRMP